MDTRRVALLATGIGLLGVLLSAGWLLTFDPPFYAFMLVFASVVVVFIGGFGTLFGFYLDRILVE